MRVCGFAGEKLMPLVVTCPSCGQKARVPEAMLGQSVKCPACGTTFTAPADELPKPPATEPVTVVPVEAPPRPPMPDAELLRSVQSGTGVQLTAHCLYAAALALFLLLYLVSVAGTLSGPSAGGPRGRGSPHLAQIILMAALLLLTGATILNIVAGALCTLAPTAQLARGLAIASLLLAILSAERSLSVIGWLPFIDEPQLGRSAFAGPWMGIYSSLILIWFFEVARLSVLALFWRAMNRVIHDQRAATTAWRLAVAGAVAQFALEGVWIVLGVLGVTGQEAAVLGLVGFLAVQLIVVLAGIGVAARLRRRLKAAVLQ
jgi:predicted Zn finger-like uncharacterized protein